MKSPSLSILEKEILKPTKDCDRFEETFTLINFFGEGGGSYLISAISEKNISELGIQEDQIVAIKLCKGEILTSVGCDAYIREANLLRLVTILRAKGICYSFPVFYMYGKCCLFYDNSKNFTELPVSCNLPRDSYTKEITVPDVLIHYANSDDSDKYEKTKALYGKECLKDIKQLFELKNFNVLAKKWSADPNKNEIYDFLLGDKDVNCGNYIVMSKINGTPLNILGPSYQLEPDLIFDMIYSNACLIKHYGFVLADRHDDNVIIGEIDFIRVYKLGSYYVKFNTKRMFYSIDLQATTDVQFTNIRNLISVGSNHLSKEMNDIFLNLSKTKYGLDEFMTEILPNVYKNFLISELEIKNEKIIIYK